MTDREAQTNIRPKIAPPAIAGTWSSPAPYADDPEADELLRECSRLQSKLRRGLRPSDILQLMSKLGWQKVTADAPTAN
jgi:hypothetical protein